jgi:protein-S-isoprenylcysteine O-methyltransferase Ste14
MHSYTVRGQIMKTKILEPAGMVVNGISIALFFYLAYTLDVPNIPAPMIYFGWLLFAAGLALIAASIATLAANRQGGLIDRGIYGMLRHPMYFGAILLFLSWICFLPHWIVILVSSANSAIVYWFILQGERCNIAKFGNAYLSYMERVPRINLVAGLLRFLQGK